MVTVRKLVGHYRPMKEAEGGESTGEAAGEGGSRVEKKWSLEEDLVPLEMILVRPPTGMSLSLPSLSLPSPS
jgi:hypothetical protein